MREVWSLYLYQPDADASRRAKQNNEFTQRLVPPMVGARPPLRLRTQTPCALPVERTSRTPYALKRRSGNVKSVVGAVQRLER